MTAHERIADDLRRIAAELDFGHIPDSHDLRVLAIKVEAQGEIIAKDLTGDAA